MSAVIDVITVTVFLIAQYVMAIWTVMMVVMKRIAQPTTAHQQVYLSPRQ